MKKFKKTFIIIFILGFGIIIGLVISKYFSTSTINTHDNLEQLGFSLLNPTVNSDLNKYFIINFKPLKDKFIDIQVKYPQKTYIYFDYLNNASWVGLNEKELYTAASTIKVPLAMSIYRMIEEGKIKASDTYSLEDIDLNKEFGDLYKVGTGKEFTVEELIKIMLEQSDNTATDALINMLRKIGINDPFSDVYAFMGWDVFPGIGETINYNKINLKTLSNMFIALYNSKYISPQNSQKILNFLTNTPFNNKIVAGVPTAISVAHKIGVSVDDQTFSDCGIIYAPNRHYILCLGSNGGNEKITNQFMAEISKAAYEYVMNN